MSDRRRRFGRRRPPPTPAEREVDETPAERMRRAREAALAEWMMPSWPAEEREREVRRMLRADVPPKDDW